MSEFSFILMGLLKAAIAGVVKGLIKALVNLHWNRILSWFQTRLRFKLDPDAIAFSIREKMATGHYQTVYGIFNSRTRKLMDAEAVISDRVDKRIADMHRDDELVIFS